MAKDARLILTGDIGGTNTRLALFTVFEDQLHCQHHATYPSADYDSLEQIVDEFMATQAEQVESACFGVAGVVTNGRCDATNLPWIMDESELAAHCQLTTVRLINDLEAAAHGVLALDENDLVELNPNAHPDPVGNRAVLAAGTGLGEATLYWDGAQYYPFATEGGHCDFAPADQLQDDLLIWLRTRWGAHVSYERILSGPGLQEIYSWLITSEREPEQPAIRSRMHMQNASAVISEAALAQQDSACEHALQLFIRIYAQEAGNMALKSLATGGIYLAGGIAPKILPALQSELFLQSWLSKGRFNTLLENIPVKVVVHPQVSLIGAAHCLLD
ncbi:MAG: glucokinase [Methylococcales bacterium]